MSEVRAPGMPGNPGSRFSPGNLQVSVVICTYNRVDLLREAVESLLRQTIAPAVYEILVVDNNSTDDTQEVARGFAAHHAHCRVCLEPEQGVSSARNRGYREARADWIAFFDDDQIAAPDYLEQILYVIDNYNFDCFGGMYTPVYKYGKPFWFRDSYVSNAQLRDTVGILEKGRYVCGGVSAFRKSAIEDCGGFSVDMGLIGKELAYGEETLLQTKMRQKGYSIGFDPLLRVGHVVNAYKLSLWWLVKAEYCHGLAWSAYGDKASWQLIMKKSFDLLISPLKKRSRKFTLQLWSERDYYIQNWAFDMAQPLAINLGIIISGIKELVGRARLRKAQ